ncbi:DUF488 family protein [Cellulomonas sp. B6]|jgi:uncharacterized protein (DUF488 family)|uniref:DUF488 domain-containing protein n=1 Tax=Cellulomonas sp. B6 TaxID=1295626 RepID=UPI00073C4210|nr:DUF488 domain-containing protein [Cellulomonas sp. B6]KSW17753.1 hypothetical protein ATM99_17950 [Cellulomonas sp. B6]
MAARLVTFGHGTLAQAEITDLLHDADVQQVVDVRRFPGSRRHPHVARDALAVWLPAAGVAYRWEERLGGRRRRDPGDDLDTWWRVDAFRAYAAYTRTGVFGAALADLLDQVRTVDGDVAVMCSEAVWWRCHRRVVADVAVLLHGVDVRHLGHDGRLTPHPPAAGARVTPRGLVYDAPREPV